MNTFQGKEKENHSIFFLKIIHITQTPMSTSRFTMSPKIPQQNKQLKKEESTPNFCHNEQINLQDL